jgi:hypothetical protein
MEVRHRPPRKLFLSVKGRTSAQVKFLSEPTWTTDKDKRDVLTAEVWDVDRNEKAMLEQYCPDAFDLSEALVMALGSTVAGKSASIVGRQATRTTNDGKTVGYLDGFDVKPL